MAIAQPTYPNGTALERPGPALALVAVLHVGIVAALLSLDVLPLPAPLATLMVLVIQTVEQQPEIAPPRPRRVSNKPLAPSRADPVPENPPLAAETLSPAPAQAPAIKEMPLPQPATMAAPPAAISEPRYDAAYLDNPAPVYPALSRRMGEEGRVVLRVFVEANGHPSQIQIRTHSGSPRLDQSAQDAVSRWKFFPAQRGAEAVGAWVLVPILFNLRG